jgi:endo-1,4-beta-D-glucanase Y
VSEGIGYGMLLAYFNNDDDTFVRLWNYTRGMREYHNRKLMPWITASFDWSPVDNSSATDADEDIATALILMYYRTGIQVYLQDALTFINAIWDTEVNPTTKLLYSGDEDLWKGKPVYNLSYFSPVALRLFAAVDTQHDWKSVLDAMYAYMQLVQSKGTGVFPDWSDASATAANPPNGAAGTNANTYTWYTFNKESVRIPWRIAWDYFWYQDTRAAAILKQLNDFIKDKAKNDPNDMALAVNYSWDLSLGKDYTKNTVVSSQWYAAWCATGIAGNTAWFNTCTTGLNTRVPSNNGGSYFADILLTMYSGLLNGLFLRPAAMP